MPTHSSPRRHHTQALLLVGVSASLLLLASHRVVELTQFCGECDSMTKHISDDGKTLGYGTSIFHFMSSKFMDCRSLSRIRVLHIGGLGTEYFASLLRPI